MPQDMVDETVSRYSYEEFLDGYTISGSSDLDLMEREDNEVPEQLRKDNQRLMFAGIAALLAGAGLFTIGNFGLFAEAWPYVLGAGAAAAGLGALRMLRRALARKTLNLPKVSLRRKADRSAQNPIDAFARPRGGFMRSDTDKVLMGVCGGLAAQSGINSTLIRALFIFAFAITSGLVAFVYFGIGLIMPAPRR